MANRRTGWSLVLLGITILSLFSFVPSSTVGATAQPANPIDTGDTAWMLACAGLVLRDLDSSTGGWSHRVHQFQLFCKASPLWACLAWSG
jgi:hypothetical protein